MTLADVLLRRVPVALGACWSENCAELAAGRIGVAMGWDQRRIAVEQESFLAEWEQFLRRVPVTSDISAARR